MATLCHIIDHIMGTTVLFYLLLSYFILHFFYEERIFYLISLQRIWLLTLYNDWQGYE